MSSRAFEHFEFTKQIYCLKDNTHIPKRNVVFLSQDGHVNYFIIKCTLCGTIALAKAEDIGAVALGR
jgi:hypothetical protein